MYDPGTRAFWNVLAKGFGRIQKGLEAIGIPEGGYINNYLDYVTYHAVFDACKTINIVPATVLDVGYGIGRLTAHYAKNAKFVVGLDISKEMIKLAKERTQLLEDKLEYVVASSSAMPFEEDIFDVVNCVAVLQHIKDSTLFNRSIQEITRVLKNNAYAILVETSLLRINKPENIVLQLNSITFARSTQYFLSQLELNNLSLVLKQGVNTSFFIGPFLKVASIFKGFLLRRETSHTNDIRFTTFRLALNLMSMFPFSLSILVDTIISQVKPSFFTPTLSIKCSYSQKLKSVHSLKLLEARFTELIV